MDMLHPKSFFSLALMNYFRTYSMSCTGKLLSNKILKKFFLFGTIEHISPALNVDIVYY